MQNNNLDTIQQTIEPLRKSGCNCAQTVAAAITQLATGQVDDTLVLLLRGAGGGLGCGDVCGCLIGASLAFGALISADEEGTRAAKRATRDVTAWFGRQFGSTACATLKKPADGTAPIPCDALIAQTVQAALPLLGAGQNGG